MNFRNIRLPKWLIQSIIMICFCAQSATAQFVLNFSETGSDTTLSGDFSGTELKLDGNSLVKWGSNTGNLVETPYTFQFSNGTAINDYDSTLSNLKGSISLWLNTENKIAQVLLELDDKLISNWNLHSFNFTATSTIVQFNDIQHYIDASDELSQALPYAGDTAPSLSFSAIPEPSTYTAIFGGLSLLGFQFSKRRKKKQS